MTLEVNRHFSSCQLFWIPVNFHPSPPLVFFLLVVVVPFVVVVVVVVVVVCLFIVVVCGRTLVFSVPETY